MPKPAAPPSQVLGRYKELLERMRRLQTRQLTLEGKEARNVGAELETIEEEAKGLERQFNVGTPPKKVIRVEPLVIEREPVELQDIEERPREERLISKRDFGRTNASRYKKMYKS